MAGKMKGGGVPAAARAARPKDEGRRSRGFGGPPQPKMQLVNLVNVREHSGRQAGQRDALCRRQGQRSRSSSKGSNRLTEISDDDAKAKLEAIQKILEKDNRKALETVGYRWAGEPKAGPGKGGFPKEPPPNPFKEGSPAEHLKSLMETTHEEMTNHPPINRRMTKIDFFVIHRSLGSFVISKVIQCPSFPDS